MALAIDIADGQDLRNEVCRELPSKQGDAVYAVHFTVKAI